MTQVLAYPMEILKSVFLSAILLTVLAAFSAATSGATGDDVTAEFLRLEKEGVSDPLAWFELAQTAREANELETARKALGNAAGFGLSPFQAAVEGARIRVLADDADGAVGELKKLEAARNAFWIPKPAP